MMKLPAIAASLLVASLPSAASAGPAEESVMAVVKAVKRGEDLAAAFPGAITPREIESLRRVAKCSATNLMRQKKGHYTMVWNCGSNGALGMAVRTSGAQVTSISTMEVVRRPNRDTP